jgi:hypothetical protein
MSLDRDDWVRGDLLGLDLPAHSRALLHGGPAFLTRAFRAAGILAADNRVLRVTESRELAGGSTGRKLLLGVEYERPAPHLHEALFVKFSRDFDDATRDAARTQMEREARFALLSLHPGFPIVVPACLFADYHRESGTGILISQRIAYGAGGVEPHYAKALDYRMPEPLAHYRALIGTLGRLAGTHRARRLPDTVERDFPFDAGQFAVAARHARYTPRQIAERVTRYADFARACPRLLPDRLRADAFLARLADEAPRLQALAPQGERLLRDATDLVALCHWNAHVDNAWFWRDPGGLLQCGLMDWGNVSRMNLAMPLWGCLSAAEPEIWDGHLNELLALFASEFERAGGPPLDCRMLKLHLALYTGLMGLAWLLDCPARIQTRAGDLSGAESRFDPRIEADERVRSQLLIMSNFLNLWERTDMAQVIARIEAPAADLITERG